jgi:Domain of unknown function (DUF4360)
MNVRSISFLSAVSLVSCITSACAADAAAEDLSSSAAAVSEATSRSEWPEDVKITVTPGEGCPDLVATPSPDFEAVTLNTSENLLSTTHPHMICRVGIDYSFPAGWRFYRPGAVMRGFTNMPRAGQTSVWVVRTKLGNGAFASENAVVRGPMLDDFSLILGNGEDAGEAATPCGATSAHIDVELIGSLFSPPDDSTISTVDSIDTEIDWDRCK